MFFRVPSATDIRQRGCTSVQCHQLARASLLNHRIGKGEQCRGTSKLSAFCGFQVDNEFKPSGLFNGEVTGLFNLSECDQHSWPPSEPSPARWAIRHEPASPTNSRQPYIVGSRRRAACSMIRARFKTAKPMSKTRSLRPRVRELPLRRPLANRQDRALPAAGALRPIVRAAASVSRISSSVRRFTRIEEDTEARALRKCAAQHFEAFAARSVDM